MRRSIRSIDGELIIKPPQATHLLHVSSILRFVLVGLASARDFTLRVLSGI